MTSPRKTGPAPLPIPSPWIEPIRIWMTKLPGRLKKGSIATRADHIRRLARAFPDGPWTVTGDMLTTWTAVQTWAPSTRRGMYATIRDFYDWAVRSGRITTSPAGDLDQVRQPAPMPRPIPERLYIEALSIADRRTRLILRLAGELGLRRAEIAAVHARDLVDDYDGPMLTVHGKGEKDREIPVPPRLADEIRWTAKRGYLFPGNDNGHLSPRWVGKLAVHALPDGWTLHTLRHRFSTVAYRIDGDLISLRDVLGHVSVATTQRYVKPAHQAKRRVVFSVADLPDAA